VEGWSERQGDQRIGRDRENPRLWFARAGRCPGMNDARVQMESRHVCGIGRERSPTRNQSSEILHAWAQRNRMYTDGQDILAEDALQHFNLPRHGVGCVLLEMDGSQCRIDGKAGT
jgi:hypothetical protein